MCPSHLNVQSQAQESLREAEAKAAAKLELKDRNVNASRQRPSSDDLRKLDGSVKKNSGFVKKLVRERERDVQSVYVLTIHVYCTSSDDWIETPHSAYLYLHMHLCSATSRNSRELL